MALTKKDRELIVKMAKENKQLRKDLTGRIDEIDKLLHSTPNASTAGTQIPDTSSQSEPHHLPVGASDSGNTIQVSFEGNDADNVKELILVETLYSTLVTLCKDNKISSLLINIDNKSK